MSSSSSSSSAGTLDASALAAQLTGTSRGSGRSGGANTVRRSPSGPVSVGSSSGEIIRRSDIVTDSAPSDVRSNGGSDASSEMAGDPVTSANFRKFLLENFDTVVDLLEQRIITQIERRGGRYRGDY